MGGGEGTARRRSTTPGHVRKREGPRGVRWEYFVALPPDPVTRRRRQLTKGGFPTRKEAQDALTAVLASLGTGTYVDRTTATLGDYLEDEWLPAIRATVRPTTWDHYARNIHSHLLPRLGAITLQELTPATLNAFYADLLSSGHRRLQGPLSAKSVRHVHTTLRKALQDATRWGRVARNVADLADPPSPKTAEMRVWMPAEIRQFLEAVDDDRLRALWRLLATTGMRRGEALGLRWQDCDLDSARVSVVQTVVVVRDEPIVSEPKTRRGRRSINLDPRTVAALRRHRREQAAERLAAGDLWQDTGLVFCREDGSGFHPDRVSNRFDRLAVAADLPPIRMHDLRHSYATAALAAGIAAKVVSERLGHANVSITLDTYSHVLPSLDEAAAEKIAGLIDG